MVTEIWTVDARQPDVGVVARAARVLAEGGIIGFPTETVYGLAANAGHPGAMERLKELKVRPEGKPFAHLLADPEDIFRVVKNPPESCVRLARRYWPGPLTIVLPPRAGNTGFRVPAHEVARQLVRLSGVRVAAPSANPSGEPPATDARQVVERFNGRIEGVLDAGPALLKESSTVVRFRTDMRWEVLREGLISRDMIARAVCKQILFVCTANRCRSPMAEALCRGLLARRFQCPEADVTLHGYLIGSAGTAATPGLPATEDAIRTMAELGHDLREHQSRAVTPEMVDHADRVYVMTQRHYESIVGLMQHLGPKIQLLDPSGKDVQDPIGGGLDLYRATIRQMRKLLEESVIPNL
jgi:protein-tyrosine phosphatase